MATTAKHPSPDSASRLEIVYVLLLLQAAFGLLGGAAMLLFMGGNPLAIPVALGTPLLLIALGAGVVRSWRWAQRATLVVQWLVLLGFVVSFAIGLLAVLDFSINLLTLITNVFLPISIIRLLRRPRPAAVAAQAASNDGVARFASGAPSWRPVPEISHGS